MPGSLPRAVVNSSQVRGEDMYDAIVVGARCAGSPTAMLLARKGYRVLLLDKRASPATHCRLTPFYSAFSVGRVPAMPNLIRYNPLRAHRYNVFPSSSPQAML